ncbi:MAG: hypothetical protein GY898_07140 [Proteobacteria bacterium]|nr:hypothetical protein [Pseudomonadota bacterium]
MARRLSILLGLALALTPAAASAEEESAQDLVYEAADAIDAAVEKRRMGESVAADALLNDAEEYLVRAERIDPDLSGIHFERARLFHVDGQADVAETMITDAMQEEFSIVDHAQAVTLLNSIRVDLDKPTVTAQWRSATGSRNFGVGMLVGGAVVSVIGYALSFSALSSGAYNQEPIDATQRDAGLVTAAVGGGFMVGAGITIVVGQVQVGQVEAILPGPWRLE